MRDEKSYDFGKVADALESFFTDEIKTIIGVEAIKFYKTRFDVMAWESPWQPLAESTKKRKKNKDRILHEDGVLKDGFGWEPIPEGVLVYNETHYAEIHNEGGTIKGVFQVNDHFRKTKYGRVNVRAHSRNVNTEIPQRQFMGFHPELIEHLENEISKRILEIIDTGDA